MLNADFIELTTEEKLRHWGIWVRCSGYSSTWFHLPELGVRKSSDQVQITDDQALFVDRGVAALKKRDPKLGKICLRFHVGGYRIVELAEMFDCHRDLASAYLRSAEAWLDGYFCSNELGA